MASSAPDATQPGATSPKALPELNAPSGWQKKITSTESGATPQRGTVYFVSPDGQEIKSKRSLEAYLKRHPGGPSASEFDWSSGETPRRSSRLSALYKSSPGTPESGSGGRKQKRRKVVQDTDAPKEGMGITGAPPDVNTTVGEIKQSDEVMEDVEKIEVTVGDVKIATDEAGKFDNSITEAMLEEKESTPLVKLDEQLAMVDEATKPAYMEEVAAEDVDLKVDVSNEVVVEASQVETAQVSIDFQEPRKQVHLTQLETMEASLHRSESGKLEPTDEKLQAGDTMDKDDEVGKCEVEPTPLSMELHEPSKIEPSSDEKSEAEQPVHDTFLCQDHKASLFEEHKDTQNPKIIPIDEASLSQEHMEVAANLPNGSSHFLDSQTAVGPVDTDL